MLYAAQKLTVSPSRHPSRTIEESITKQRKMDMEIQSDLSAIYVNIG